MQTVPIPASEASAFEEYLRQKKRTELQSKLRNLEPTLLKRNATSAEVRTLCEQAKRLNSVCIVVQPLYVKTCRALLKGSGVGISCLIGGNSESAVKTKLYECKRAVADGATEFDFCPALSPLANGNYAYLKREVRKIVRRARGKIVKVRLDDGFLSAETLYRSAQAAAEGGASFLTLRADGALIDQVVRRLKKPCAVKAWAVESAEGFRTMLSLGVGRASSELAEEIFRSMEQEKE